MTKIIYFDVCAIFILTPVIAAMIRKNMKYGKVNRWFFVFAGTVLFTTVSDVAAVGLDIMGEGHVYAKYFAHTAYLLGRAFVTPTFVAYLFARVGIWFKTKNYRTSLLWFMFPTYVLGAVILFVNPFWHIIFYLAENDAYTRASGMYAMYALSFAYALVGYVTMIKNKKALDLSKILYLLFVFTFALSSTIFQFFFPNIIVECFALSISALIIALGVQAPEERMFENTNILNLNAFNDDIFIAREMDANVGIVLLALTNYDTLMELLGFEAYCNCMKKISDRFISERKEKRFNAELYYLHRGCYCVMSINRKNDEVKKIAGYVNEIFTESMSIDDVEVRFIVNECLAGVPADIANVKDILTFVNRLKDRDYTGDVRYAKDMFDKHEYDIRRNIETIIERAIDSESLYLMYQPIYSLKDERYVAAEAFLRLKDPVFGEIKPEIVISEAERYGAINGITTYLLDELCRFISGPEFMQLNLQWVELNLSPVQLNWKDLVSVFVSTIRHYHVNPTNVCINIVDEAETQPYEQMYDNIVELKNMGVKIYMDDFGAGVFEIKRIASLPLDGIKLDREFIRLGIREDAMVILENSVNLIRDMELDVVAVGVEDLIMRRRLSEIGCYKQQGYYYNKPMTKEEMIRFTIGLPRAKKANGGGHEKQILF